MSQVGQTTLCSSNTIRDKNIFPSQKHSDWLLHAPAVLCGRYLGLNLLGSEASARIRNELSYTSTSLCLHGVHLGNISFDYIFITQSVLNF
jgi:hypothetical protein